MFDLEMVKKNSIKKHFGLRKFLVQDKVGLRKFFVQDKVGLLEHFCSKTTLDLGNFHHISFLA